MLGAIPPLIQYVFMAWYLVKNRDNFTLTLYVCLYSKILERYEPNVARDVMSSCNLEPLHCDGEEIY